ncbi:MAG: fructosamine kinase family protein [Opitutae bacterium]|jgi:protein-ribulosamine 3-kinase|nr:fructosamine kinase family protein [Opitutae bacterium]MBT7743354.1 fructosamine kinase family protein [Opitutae bacterium]MBT7923294.1 fructosamine kinase family protein [Opitutae bacterium]
MWEDVATAIAKETQTSFVLHSESNIAGGCINEARRLESTTGEVYFVKANSADFLRLFKAEAKALTEIASTRTVCVPEPVCHGTSADRSFLVMEFLETGRDGGSAQRKLGQDLARLHRIKQPHFGWKIDNAIGATHQPNPASDDWIAFYREHRLVHQFDLAQKKDQSFHGVESLIERLPDLFSEYKPWPSLLHGDLWGGNFSVDTEGQPYVFDPASYYGDREADIAFTYMFGGFSKDFYKGYEEIFPLDPGFEIRKTLYNLYHELNHYNLFGGGYARSAQSSINHLLAYSP